MKLDITKSKFNKLHLVNLDFFEIFKKNKY